MLAAKYKAEWSPKAASSLQNECEISSTSPFCNVEATIVLPTASTQRSKGSVSDFVAAPSPNGDLDMISCRASEAATKTGSFSSEGSNRAMRIVIKGVRSLKRASDMMHP